MPEVPDDTKPVLFQVEVGKYYYIHKGKNLKDSVNKMLDDVHREIKVKADAKVNPEKYDNRKDYCPQYSKLIEYFALHPQIYKVSVRLLLNAEPDKILKEEAKLYKAMKSDENSLNNLEIGQFKPEWMLRHTFKEKCNKCHKNGIIEGKKIEFNFCPICGRSIK
jgi:hypothetical protein